MPNLSGLINAISNDVVAKRAAGGLAPLVDGAILIGRQHIAELSAPPRIVFIPVSSTFGPRAMYSASQIIPNPTAEQKQQWLQRALLTETVKFEVHVWGIGVPPDPNGGDFDATQQLYQQIMASTHLLAVGSYKIESGVWTDQKPNASQLVKSGHEYVFMLSLDTPVLDQPLTFVPPDTIGDATLYLQPPNGGDPEEAETGV